MIESMGNDEILNEATLQKIFLQTYLESEDLYFSDYDHRVANAIMKCRTPEMGSYLRKCLDCGYEIANYKSCRNRHCPQCQQIAKAEWLNARQAELLPVKYFHMVFTLPHFLNPIILQNRKMLYNLLFESVHETINAFCHNPKNTFNGTPGYISILHTWDQQLNYHVHLHLVVPGLVLRDDCVILSRDGFYLPVKACANIFRGKYIAKLRKLNKHKQLTLTGKYSYLNYHKSFCRFLKTAFANDWIVYAKKPFNGVKQVFDYLGRYTHRIAISNNRIRSFVNGMVTIDYRDRKDKNKVKQLTISATEFIRRFIRHVLPYRFTRIRSYGFLANRTKKSAIERIRHYLKNGKIPATGAEIENNAKCQKMTTSELMFKLIGEDIDLCPVCQKGRLIIVNYNYKPEPVKNAEVLLKPCNSS